VSLEDNIRALSRTPVLAEIGRDALRLLAFSVEEVSLRPGDVLFERGNAADCAYVIVRGSLNLDAGGDSRMVGRGALIGELALVVETYRPCDAVAVEPVKLLAVPRPVFRKMLEEFPNIARDMKQRLAGKLRAEHAALARLKSHVDKLPGGKTES
jgi:CRP-like cAMP-binding protein